MTGGAMSYPQRGPGQGMALPQGMPARKASRGPIRPLPAADQAIGPSRTQRQLVWDSFRSHRMAFIGLCTLGTMAVLCLVLPFFLPDPTAIDTQLLRATPPSAEHLLGTDQIGRDVLSRLVNAGRISLLIGVMVAFFSAVIGSVVGTMAGYFGGKVDASLMWIVNVLMTIPSIPLMTALAVLVANDASKVGFIFGKLPSEWRIITVFVALGWLGLSRVVRSQVMSLREQEFCEAARALGAKHSRVMFVHILPNTVSVIAVFTTLAVSGAIIGEASLSFLGFGVQPPTATWGNMLYEARDLFTILQYWWLAWFPALAILITVLSVNFIGDGVRDALDPKSMKK
jgi:peptide/nickel transport system permease protein